MIKEDIIMAYVLKNAVEHEGKATKGPIINSLFNHGLKKKDIPSILPRIQKVINKVNNWYYLQLVKGFMIFIKRK